MNSQCEFWKFQRLRQRAVAPGIGFGEYGEGYVRIGLVENEQRIRQAARNVKKFLDRSGQILSTVRELEAENT